MTDENAAAEAASAKQTEVSEVETKAREQGWTPKEDFKGAPDKWIDAETFVKRGDPRYLRKELDQTRAEIAELRETAKREREEQQQSFKDRLERMDKANQAVLKKQREQIYADFDKQKRAAVEDGDTERYDRIAQQESKVREDHAKEDEDSVAKSEPKKAEKQQVRQHDENVILNWWANNLDVRMDDKLANAAGILFSKAERDPANKTTQDVLKAVEAGLSKYRNGKGAANGSADTASNMGRVESGQKTAASSSSKKGWADIPAEERAIYARHIEEGLYKDQAEAAKTHWGS